MVFSWLGYLFYSKKFIYSHINIVRMQSESQLFLFIFSLNIFFSFFLLVVDTWLYLYLNYIPLMNVAKSYLVAFYLWTKISVLSFYGINFTRLHSSYINFSFPCYTKFEKRSYKFLFPFVFVKINDESLDSFGSTFVS